MRLILSHRPTFTQELGATAHLAAPIALAFVAQLGMGMTDTIMLGALGRDALGAGGLGAAAFFVSCSVVQGMLSAVAILIAHVRGAQNEARIGLILRAGYAVALLSALPLMVLLWFAEPLLLAAGEPPALAAMVAPYVRVLALATPAFMWLATQRSYLSAMSRPRLIPFVSLSALVVNGLLNYGLIHGAWGLPEIGYLGSAMATAITIYLQVIVMSVGMRLMRGLPRAKLVGAIAWADAREILHLGWAIAITVGVESGVFFAAALLMGIIGPSALAAHQITIQFAAMMFMVPMATGQAANVRVGFHAGAGAMHAAQRAGYAALTIGAVFAVVAGGLIAIFPERIAALFGLDPTNPTDADVMAQAAKLLVICAAFQLADGAQTIVLGALRGLKDTRVPMLMASAGYWLVGFPTAWLFGLKLGYGGPGVWWALALSLCVVAVMLLWRFQNVSSRARDGARIEDAARMAFAPAVA